MGHVSYVSRDQADESIRPIYDDLEKKRGVVLNFFKAMAHNPAILQAFGGLNAALGKLKLAGKLRELAYLKASQTNGCEY